MAKRLSDPQRQEVAAFLLALYKLGGYGTQKEMADDAGYHPVNLSDVMNGKSGIEGHNLIKIIHASARRAGLAPEEAAVEALKPLATPANRALQQTELEAAIEALDGLSAQLRHLLEATAGRRA